MVVRFLLQFHNALIYFLLSGAAAATLLGHVADAVMIVLNRRLAERIAPGPTLPKSTPT